MHNDNKPDVWLVVARGDDANGEPDEIVAILETAEDAAEWVEGFCDGDPRPRFYCQIRTANFGDCVGLD